MSTTKVKKQNICKFASGEEITWEEYEKRYHQAKLEIELEDLEASITLSKLNQAYIDLTKEDMSDISSIESLEGSANEIYSPIKKIKINRKRKINAIN